MILMESKMILLDEQKFEPSKNSTCIILESCITLNFTFFK